jgi:hypothetical protein
MEGGTSRAKKLDIKGYGVSLGASPLSSTLSHIPLEQAIVLSNSIFLMIIHCIRFEYECDPTA